MIGIIVVSLVAILLLDYVTSRRILSRPSISYIVGFLLCAIVAYSWRVEWGLHKMSYGTVFLFVGGALIYYLVEAVYLRCRPIQVEQINVRSDYFVPIKPQKLILFLLFQIVVYYFYSRSKILYTGADSLGDAIWQIREETFDGQELKIPSYIGLPYGFCRAAGYVWSILLPYYFIKSQKYHIQKILILINLLVCMYGVFLAGGRMGFVFYIFPLIFVYYILYQYMKGWKGGFFSKKTNAYILISFVLFGFFFAQLGYAMGRKESTKTVSMIFSMYCGAQIKNMDDYIRYPYKQGHEGEYFGQYTFKRIYKGILDNILDSKHRSADPAYNFYGDYALGNVYSTYQDYYIDFRYYGILLAGLMSLFVVFIYKKAIISHFWKDGRLSIWLLFYAYISHMPILSFFANQFWGKITIKGDLYNIIYWFILILFFQGYKSNYYKKIGRLDNNNK